MKDAPRFLWDSNAFRDPKVLRLRARHGVEGYGAFQMLVCMMREQDGYKLEICDVEVYALEMGIEPSRLIAIVLTCLEVGLFDRRNSSGHDTNSFWAPALNERMAEWDAKKAKRSAAGRVGRQAQLMRRLETIFQQSPEENKQSPEKSGDCPEVPIQDNTIQELDLDLKDLLDAQLLKDTSAMAARCPALVEWWPKWLSYLAAIKKPYKTAQSVKLALKPWLEKPDDLCAAIEQSIANGWQGLFPLKPDFRQRRSRLDADLETLSGRAV